MRATKIEVRTLLLQRCAMRKFHVIDDQNTGDQITRGRSDEIAFCVVHSCLVEIRTVARRVARNNILFDLFKKP